MLPYCQLGEGQVGERLMERQIYISKFYVIQYFNLIDYGLL